MELHHGGRSLRRELNRIWWKRTLLLASIGIALAWLIYVGGLYQKSFRFEETHTGLLLALCPPIIMTMAITQQSRAEVAQIYAIISALNGVLYFIAGMLLATALEQWRCKREGLWQTRDSTAVASGSSTDPR